MGTTDVCVDLRILYVMLASTLYSAKRSRFRLNSTSVVVTYGGAFYTAKKGTQCLMRHT